MTTSDYKKMHAQLIQKPDKLKKYEKHNSPKKRSCGIALKKCILCGTHRAIISKYTLNICRRCFRETANKIGFKKYR